MVNIKKCIKTVYFINNQLKKEKRYKDKIKDLKISKRFNKNIDEATTYFGVDYVVNNLKSDKNIKRI